MNEVQTNRKLEITVNGEAQMLDPTSTVSQLLEVLQINQRGIAVELNGNILPRELHADRQVQAGDTFEIVTLVGGG